MTDVGLLWTNCRLTLMIPASWCSRPSIISSSCVVGGTMKYEKVIGYYSSCDDIKILVIVLKHL